MAESILRNKSKDFAKNACFYSNYPKNEKQGTILIVLQPNKNMPSALARRRHFYTYSQSIVPTDLGVRFKEKILLYLLWSLYSLSIE